LKLIIGIGNPGARYVNTRHNIGFNILDTFCQKHNLNFIPTKSDFWKVESDINAFHFFLVKPTIYVNRSGIVIKEIVQNYDLKSSDLLVIYDDSNLDVADIRIRKSGGDGGHNGIKSLIYHLENDNFNRLRIGVGSPKNNDDLADYVLSNFPKEDIEKIESKIPLIIELTEQFIKGGITQMLNYYSNYSNVNSSKI
jgi:PTH1 family peptidyl-tRNA hydrolase